MWIAPTLDLALDRLATDTGARPIAGGVGVLLARALGTHVPDRWVGIGALPELSWRRDGAIGAATTLEALAGYGSLLAAVAAGIANPGVRVVGTIGGNVVAGGAASELAVALVALAASARLVGPGGERSVAAEDLVLQPGELVRSFEMPTGALAWGWQRLTLHGAMDRSSASVAVTIGEHGVRVVVGCAAPLLLRLPATEAASVDGPLRHVREAAAADLDGVALLDDDRATAAYRRRVIPVLVERAVREARQAREPS